jgi:hypothetical protein
VVVARVPLVALIPSLAVPPVRAASSWERRPATCTVSAPYRGLAVTGRPLMPTGTCLTGAALLLRHRRRA